MLNERNNKQKYIWYDFKTGQINHKLILEIDWSDDQERKLGMFDILFMDLYGIFTLQ